MPDATTPKADEHPVPSPPSLALANVLKSDAWLSIVFAVLILLVLVALPEYQKMHAPDMDIGETRIRILLFSLLFLGKALINLAASRMRKKMLIASLLGSLPQALYGFQMLWRLVAAKSGIDVAAAMGTLAFLAAFSGTSLLIVLRGSRYLYANYRADAADSTSAR